MGLFGDMNAMFVNARGQIEFERQVAELSSATREYQHMQEIKMVGNSNQRGSTIANEQISDTINNSNKKRVVVKKVARKEKRNNQNSTQFEGKHQEKSGQDGIQKTQSNTTVYQTTIIEPSSHYRLPDISTIRDGVVWSEILGPPRCKKRYNRYKNK